MPSAFRDALTVRSHFEAVFPNLSNTKWSIKSPFSDAYQCIAWAACRTDRKWWPGLIGYWWPPNAPSDDSVDCFVETFGLFGYRRCSDRAFEPGYQKVAIYASSDRKVLHMARQHFFGKGWLSKCGTMEDIQHADLESIESDPSPFFVVAMGTYGSVDTVLKPSWWSALIHLCMLRCLSAAFRFWLYRVVHPSWKV